MPGPSKAGPKQGSPPPREPDEAALAAMSNQELRIGRQKAGWSDRLQRPPLVEGTKAEAPSVQWQCGFC